MFWTYSEKLSKVLMEFLPSNDQLGIFSLSSVSEFYLLVVIYMNQALF